MVDKANVWADRCLQCLHNQDTELQQHSLESLCFGLHHQIKKCWLNLRNAWGCSPFKTFCLPELFWCLRRNLIKVLDSKWRNIPAKSRIPSISPLISNFPSSLNYALFFLWVRAHDNSSLFWVTSEQTIPLPTQLVVAGFFLDIVKEDRGGRKWFSRSQVKKKEDPSNNNTHIATTGGMRKRREDKMIQC